MGVVCVCNQKENHNLLGLPYVDTYLEYHLTCGQKTEPSWNKRKSTTKKLPAHNT